MRSLDSACRRIERKSSIESEPQTLSLDQIRYAREKALYVLHTNSFEDAIRIFTEGLQPVQGVVKNINTNITDPTEDAMLVDRNNAVSGLRDTVTAPF